MKKVTHIILSLAAFAGAIHKAPAAIVLASLSLLLVACGGKTQAEKNREEAERHGATLLDEARRALRAEDYEMARNKVITLRREQPLALDARRKAILLLDSIELRAATDSVRFLEGEEWERVNMKMQFYQRKLGEDIKAYGE